MPTWKQSKAPDLVHEQQAAAWSPAAVHLDAAEDCERLQRTCTVEPCAQQEWLQQQQLQDVGPLSVSMC